VSCPFTQGCLVALIARSRKYIHNTYPTSCICVHDKPCAAGAIISLFTNSIKSCEKENYSSEKENYSSEKENYSSEKEKKCKKNLIRVEY
jgi:hypothetical protein